MHHIHPWEGEVGAVVLVWSWAQPLGSALGSHLQRIPNRANMARAESKKRKGPGWSRPPYGDVVFPSSLWGMGRGGRGTPRNPPTFGMKEKIGPKVQKSEQNTCGGLGLEAAWPSPSLLHMLSLSPRTAGREENRGTGGGAAVHMASLHWPMALRMGMLPCSAQFPLESDGPGSVASRWHYGESPISSAQRGWHCHTPDAAL